MKILYLIAAISLFMLMPINVGHATSENTVGVLEWTTDVMQAHNSSDSVTFNEIKRTEEEARKEAQQALVDEYLKNSATGSAYHNRVIDFIKKIGVQAHAAYSQDVYPSVLIAQAIIESNAGKSGLSDAPNYNMFGIKGSYNGMSVSMATFEDDGSGNLYNINAYFRKYPSYTESVSDYVALIKMPSGFYSGAWRSNTSSYKDATLFLTGRYATATNYNTVLDSTIENYNLTRFDQEMLSDFTIAWLASDSYSVTEINIDELEVDLPEDIQESYSSVPERFLPMIKQETPIVTENPYTIGSSMWFITQRTAQSGRYISFLLEDYSTWDMTTGNLKMRVLSEIKQGQILVFTEEDTVTRIAYIEAFNDTEILISESGPDLPLTGVYRVIPRDESLKYISC